MQAVKAALKPDVAAAAWSALALANVDFEQIASVLLTHAKPIPRIDDATSMTGDEFERDYERSSTPAILGGLMTGWPPAGANLWRVSGLQAAGAAAGGIVFEVGDDPRREGSVLCELDEFVEYMQRDCDGDDEPVYLFDGTFETSLPSLLEAYAPPPMMEHDLMGVIDTLDDRPPFRWVICGGRRSGSALHQDPLATAAWNTLTQGRKLWVLLPPTAPRDLLFLTEAKLQPPAAAAAGVDEPPPNGPDRPLGAAQWFARGLPRLLDLVSSEEGAGAGAGEAGAGLQVFATIQEAGETIFVPHGWWHAVLNLDGANLAVTQNFASPHNLRAVLEAMAEEHGPAAAGGLLRRLAATEQWPTLQARLGTRQLEWMELPAPGESACDPA